MSSGNGIALPDALAAALAGDAEALAVFERMRPSCRREYVRWVAEARTEATRTRRAGNALTRIRDYGARHGLLCAPTDEARS
jgi:uncharacterized protein YdeI (YjbR/CyaY-like superfamily)